MHKELQLNVHNNLILVNDVDKTQEIESYKYDKSNNKYKIIAPYRKQTEAIQQDLLSYLDVSIVHKFQGREKDDIIQTRADEGRRGDRDLSFPHV